jgi:hypothetical protein
MSTSEEYTLHSLQDSLQEKRDEWSKATRDAGERLSRSGGPCVTEIHSLANLIAKLAYLESEYSKMAGIYVERCRMLDRISGAVNE